MKKIILGRTGIEVTELCFGTLPMGPLQKDLSPDAAADIIAYGLKAGINFVDTAQMYRTYPHIRLAIEKSGITPVISTKSGAATYSDMQEAVEQAMTELGPEVNKIDIFLLHAARVSKDVLTEREGALKCLLEYKNKGIIKAVGISTHVVDVVKAAAVHPQIDVVFPLLNHTGMGIAGGAYKDMEAAVNLCHKNNKGIFVMKVLAGGNLVKNYKAAMDYIAEFSSRRFSYSIGMLSKAEVDMNMKYLRGEDISNELEAPVVTTKNFVVMRVLCIKCGKCVAACHSDAIHSDEATAALIDQAKCLKCGYCVTACPQFAIRMN